MKIKLNKFFVKAESKARTIDHMIYEETLNLTGITSNDIKRRVNQRLNTKPQEKRMYMRYRLTKFAIVTTAILTLGAGSVFATSHIDLLKEFFVGDTKILQKEIQKPNTNMQNEEYKVTLEQVLADPHEAIIVFSVEGLTTEAINELETNSMFLFESNMKLETTPGSETKTNGYEHTTLEGSNSFNKRYFAFEVHSIDNPKQEPMRLYLNKAKSPELFITVPMNSNIPTFDFQMKQEAEANGKKYTLERMSINSISMVVDSRGWNGIEGALPPEIFFRMANGTIKTKNQLVNPFKSSSSILTADHEGIYRFYFRFKEIINIDDIQSVIIDQMEYPLHRKVEPKPVVIDGKLHRFTSRIIKHEKSEKYGPLMSVDEVSKGLGAEYSWDQQNAKLIFTYRGTTLELVAGGNKAIVNGQETPLQDFEGVYMQNGELSLSPNLLEKYFDIEYSLQYATKMWIVSP
ncbi:stalk domain-containing protein [Paenibacillus guangzhouensis]|uniref:stalk domain-containing protein n=1 Tax=Paenibacillus guangzhouensis TaxID=1473112 RepID=UPI001266C71E|nr:stalk domain-containing protein [Paenibacillus guangzhouensis]